MNADFDIFGPDTSPTSDQAQKMAEMQHIRDSMAAADAGAAYANRAHTKASRNVEKFIKCGLAFAIASQALLLVKDHIQPDNVQTPTNMESAPLLGH